MIEFGKTLRDAREAKGYSTSQIAEMTRMMLQVVEDLEAENFARIPAPIYGRGFVKLYCEAVGIDAKPLIEEYMAIQSSAREATIRVRPVEMPPPDPARYETPAPPMPDTAPAPAAAPEAGLPPHAVTRAAPPPDNAFLPHTRREFRLPEMNLPPIPRNTWRIALVAGVAALVLWGLVAGFRALYRATMRPPAVAPAEPTAPKRAETPAARVPQKIPPLYID